MEERSEKNAREWIASQLRAGVKPHELHDLVDTEVAREFNRLSVAERKERMRADQNEVDKDKVERELENLKDQVKGLGDSVAKMST